MLTFIPSKTLCKYIQDKNIKFTDSEEATIIYNAGNMRCHDNDIYDLDSKNAALRNLMEQTSDTTLRQQISERLDEDEKVFQKFATDSDDIFFTKFNYMMNAMTKMITCFFLLFGMRQTGRKNI